nr:hypothetical protein [uncultured Campylobacter sp.]
MRVYRAFIIVSHYETIIFKKMMKLLANIDFIMLLGLFSFYGFS